MNLPSPVTITPPPIPQANGQPKTYPPFTLTSLDMTIMDSSAQRTCVARFARFQKPLLLWHGDAYDEAGDYTQADAEARALELLGEDIQASLQDLFLVNRRLSSQ